MKQRYNLSFAIQIFTCVNKSKVERLLKISLMNIVRLDDLCHCVQVLEYVCEKEARIRHLLRRK